MQNLNKEIENLIFIRNIIMLTSFKAFKQDKNGLGLFKILRSD